jgi:hypothetical protein
MSPFVQTRAPASRALAGRLIPLKARRAIAIAGAAGMIDTDAADQLEAAASLLRLRSALSADLSGLPSRAMCDAWGNPLRR